MKQAKEEKDVLLSFLGSSLTGLRNMTPSILKKNIWFSLRDMKRLGGNVLQPKFCHVENTPVNQMYHFRLPCLKEIHIDSCVKNLSALSCASYYNEDSCFISNTSNFTHLNTTSCQLEKMS